MSGHNKWSKIKRKKGATDIKRSNLFSKLARTITVAARSGKGLDLTIEQAKKANMPRDNIQRAIDKGTGKVEGAEITEVRYEAYGPEGIGIIIDALTDNKNRALAEIKATLNKYNGKLATSGAVLYLFEELGVIEIVKEGQSITGEDLEMTIIESGAKDYSFDEGVIYIYTNSKELEKVKKNLEFKSLKIENAKLEMSPGNYIKLDEHKQESVVKLLSALEELEDVSEVYTNADL